MRDLDCECGCETLTEKQKEAGNYAKTHLRWGGFEVAIETPKGGVRSGTGGDGKVWKVTMPVDYGYLKKTLGVDGDHVDVFLGPVRDVKKAGTVWVLEQMDKKTGKFDEHKLLAGFATKAAGLAAYLKSFTDDAKGRVGKVTEVPVGELKGWLRKKGLARRSLGLLVKSEGWGMKMRDLAKEKMTVGERVRGGLVGATAGTALVGTLAGSKGSVKVPNAILKRLKMKPGRLKGGKGRVNFNPARVGAGAGLVIGAIRPPKGKAQEVADAASGYGYMHPSFAELVVGMRELAKPYRGITAKWYPGIKSVPGSARGHLWQQVEGSFGKVPARGSEEAKKAAGMLRVYKGNPVGKEIEAMRKVLAKDPASKFKSTPSLTVMERGMGPEHFKKGERATKNMIDDLNKRRARGKQVAVKKGLLGQPFVEMSAVVAGMRELARGDYALKHPRIAKGMSDIGKWMEKPLAEAANDAVRAVARKQPKQWESSLKFVKSLGGRERRKLPEMRDAMAEEIRSARKGTKQFTELVAGMRELMTAQEEQKVRRKAGLASDAAKAVYYGTGAVATGLLARKGFKVLDGVAKRNRAVARATMKKAASFEAPVRKIINDAGVTASNLRPAAKVYGGAAKGILNVAKKLRVTYKGVKRGWKKGMKEGAAAAMSPEKVAARKKAAGLKASMQRAEAARPARFAEVSPALRHLEERKKRPSMKKVAAVGAGALAGAALGARTLPRMIRRGRPLAVGETTTGKILFTNEGLTTVAEVLGKKHKLGKAAAKGSKLAGLANKVDDFFGIPQRHYGLGVGGGRVAEKTKAHRARVVSDDGFARGKKMYVDSDVTPKTAAAAEAMDGRFKAAAKGERMCMGKNNCEHFAREVGGQGKVSHQMRAIVGGAAGGAAVGGAGAAVAMREKKKKELSELVGMMRELYTAGQLRRDGRVYDASGEKVGHRDKHNTFINEADAWLRNKATTRNGKPSEPSMLGVIRGVHQQASRGAVPVQRGVNLVRDAADSLTGTVRKDSSGRVKRKEWDKQWVKKALTGVALTGAGLGLYGTRKWARGVGKKTKWGKRVRAAEEGFGRGKENLLRRAEGAVGSVAHRLGLGPKPDVKLKRPIRFEGKGKSPVIPFPAQAGAKKAAVPAVKKAATKKAPVKKAATKKAPKKVAANIPKKVIQPPVLAAATPPVAKVQTPPAPSVAEVKKVEAAPPPVKKVETPKVETPPALPAKKKKTAKKSKGAGLPKPPKAKELAAVMSEVLREFAPGGNDPYYSAPGWDVRDARGKSARVFAPNSRKRVRREKTWSERKENRDKLAIGAAIGALGLGVGAGYQLGKRGVRAGAKKVPVRRPVVRRKKMTPEMPNVQKVRFG